MNEFDKGHLVGYREGRNDILRGGLNEEKPSFLRGSARGIFVLWLVVFSLFGSAGSLRHRLAVERYIVKVEAVLDELQYVVMTRRLQIEGQVRDLVLDLERRVNGE